MSNLQTRVIKGQYIADSGIYGDHTEMVIEVSDAGEVFDAEGGERLTVALEKSTDTVYEEIISNGSWRFGPKGGELDRCGIKAVHA